MNPIVAKFLATVDEETVLKLRHETNYRAILRIVLDEWPEERRQQVESELRAMRNCDNDDKEMCEFTKLVWYDFKVKEFYKRLDQHKRNVQVCYHLFNNTALSFRVKGKLILEDLLTSDYMSWKCPTEEQMAAHDDSKYHLEECMPYAMRYQSPLGDDAPADVGWYTAATGRHYNRNAHHPEHWHHTTMTWRYILQAVYDMSAMQLEKEFDNIVPKTRGEQLKLITFEDKYLYRFRETGQLQFVKRLLELMQEAIVDGK